jgi:hypothetical protein
MYGVIDQAHNSPQRSYAESDRHAEPYSPLGLFFDALIDKYRLGKSEEDSYSYQI